MTFNVRVPVASDGSNAWPNRRALLIETLRRHQPDVIGTQELTREQGMAIVAALPVYGWFGRDRRGGRDDEHTAIFYRRDRLRIVRMGDFQLSDTPEVPGSISWGHPYPRMASWAEFATLADGRRFVMVNTHLPYRAEDTDARLRGARLILERIATIAGDLPVVLTGDFNTAPDGPVHAALSARLTDAWTAAPDRKGPAGTFHNFTGAPGDRIDWIFARGLAPRSATTLTDRRDARYPSDHFPVLVHFAPQR